MLVRVLAFGVLREVLPSAEFSLDLAASATASASRSPKDWNAIAVAVNREYAARSRALAEGDEVALLPPVSGGSGSDPIFLTRDPLDTQELLRALRHPEDGAVASFDGIVRNNTRGRRTLYLDYEAYEQMALEQMRSLAAEAKQRYAIHEVTIAHRLGRLEIGETSVFLAVCSAHRGAAFDACRWLIDTLKKTVPIWKKEHFEDGAVWTDGEPFPPELLTEERS
jgi:molybdopterin synthase catalytic subunit/molybdopterin converting factor small subunit